MGVGCAPVLVMLNSGIAEVEWAYILFLVFFVSQHLLFQITPKNGNACIILVSSG